MNPKSPAEIREERLSEAITRHFDALGKEVDAHVEAIIEELEATEGREHAEIENRFLTTIAECYNDATRRW